MDEPIGSQNILCQIANCAFEVVSGLLNRDQLLAETLRSPETSSHQIFREECITVDMVSTLRERFPDHIEITMFTGDEESHNGADWYWRIQKGRGAIHARVQAKRIRRSAFRQKDSNGTVQIDMAQLQKLIDTAESDREILPNLQSWLATYARFDADPPCGNHPSMCNNHGCENSCTEQEIPSIWIAKAKEILETGRTKPIFQVKDIVEKSLRLDCILPCIDRSIDEGPSAKGFNLFANLPTYETCIMAIQNNPALQASFDGAIQIKL
jgi:hypothetical protein